MEVADEIAYAWKDLCNGLEDTGTHIMNAGGRGSIIALKLAQEGNNVLGVFTGQLHVGEYDFA